MDVEQLFAEFPQLGGGGGAAVDPGAALALAVDRAAQQQREAGIEAEVKAGLFQPGAQSGAFIEFRADIGAGRTLANQAGVGARPGDQLQRIDQDRLAGARLAGEHGESTVQVELELVDDDEVPQDDSFQSHVKCSIAHDQIRRCTGGVIAERLGTGFAGPLALPP